MSKKIKPIVEVMLVLDASDSMKPYVDQVRNGINEYVGNLRSDLANDYRISLTIFSSKIGKDPAVKTTIFRARLVDFPVLTKDHYRTFMLTALWDGMGHAIETMTRHVKTPQKPLGARKVIVVTWTDGMENASERHTEHTVAKLIGDRQEAGNWTFVFLGANVDAWAIARKVGIPRGNVMRYDVEETQETYSTVSRGTIAYAMAMPMSTSEFFQDEEAGNVVERTATTVSSKSES